VEDYLFYGSAYDHSPGLLVMASVSRAKLKTIPGYVAAPKISIRFRVLREGEVTATEKFVRLYRDWNSVDRLCLAFQTEVSNGGEYTQAIQVDLATFLAQGEWLVAGQDNAPPRKARASYISFGASGTVLFNITSGEGAAAGTPATVEALVKVDKVLAAREVVVVERPADGQWRVAGYGTSVAGELEVELKVVGGDCYAIGLDTWGTVFQSSLSVTVDSTIRPTTFTGWLYRITEAGILPLAEPPWWAAEGDNAPRQLGTARAVAVRYYAPLALGPFPVKPI
jgi:hypothetical protein